LLFRLGKDGRFRFLSDAGAALLSVRADELDGRPFTDLVAQEERSRIRGYLQEILRAERVETLRLKLRTGRDRFTEFEIFFRTVPHPQTQAPEILGLGRPLVRAAEAPAQAPLGELGARLAHELSQPLTAIGGTSRVCARRLRDLLGPDNEITQAIEQMADQTERAAEMIRRLRQLSTGSAPHRSSVDLNKLVEDTLASLAGPVRQAKVPVALDLAPNLPLLQADRIQLGQVLLNLVRNALEAMAEVPSAQRQLTVRTRRADTEAEVSVSDTGPGISVGTIEKLFQPYHTTKAHGMGLGLALCRSILQAHQGRLWVKPNTPRGASFFFALPLHP
jgi:signal transduction histidine kinase